MSLSVLRSKKGVHPIIGLVVGAVVLFVGIYVIMQIVNSITLPTSTYVNDSLTFTNNTAVQVTYPYCNSVGSIQNYTDTFPNDRATMPGVGYTCDTSGITIYTNESYLAGTYNATYVYNLQQGNSTFSTTQTTFWNSMQLGAVSLITLAASLVLGSLFFR